jgi:hypothetical protein
MSGLIEVIIPAASGAAGVIGSLATQFTIAKRRERLDRELAKKEDFRAHLDVRRIAYQDLIITIAQKRPMLVRYHELVARMQALDRTHGALVDEVAAMRTQFTDGVIPQLASAFPEAIVASNDFSGVLNASPRETVLLIEPITSEPLFPVGSFARTEEFATFLPIISELADQVLKLKDMELTDEQRTLLGLLTELLRTIVVAFDGLKARFDAVYAENQAISAEVEILSEELASWNPTLERWRLDITQLATDGVRMAGNVLLQAFIKPDSAAYEAALKAFKEEMRKELRGE